MSHFRRLQQNRAADNVKQKKDGGTIGTKIPWRELIKLNTQEVATMAQKLNIDFVGKMKTLSIINKAQ